MKRTFVALAAAAAMAAGTAQADEKGTFGRLDHVFLIIMENQTDTDILGNANAPFINAYAKVANRATKYFAVGHPSAPNYLEIIGGSNFGLTDDFWPNWVNTGCIDNAPNSTGCVNSFTPIAAAGLDNPVVATAKTPNDCNGQITLTTTPVANNCALYDYPAKVFTPKSIADQLVARQKSWKTYQESLPIVAPGVFGVNYADGAFSNLSPAAVFAPGPIQKLYAVKHDPFAYFRNIELDEDDELGLAQVKDFDGTDGLWADLQSPEKLPNLMVIVPNQCHDMHGFVSGGTPICSAATTAESAFLMSVGDVGVEKLVKGIKASDSWKEGRNAIVLVWDENDFSNAANSVVMLVETNYAPNGRVSNTPYDHFSLLRTLEAGFGLPCLNHACDATSKVMNDMFGG
ncbi:MAG: alkaline phosphatase family protein [Stellaceae bacterium]